MFGRTVGIATTLALAANAFLLPPNLAPASNDNANEDDKTPNNFLSAVEATLARNTLVTIPCSACAFPAEKPATIENENGVEEPAFHIQGGANSIVLDVSVSEDGKKVLVNEDEVFPGSPQLQGMQVYQVPSRASLAEIESGEVVKTALEVTGSVIGFDEEKVVSETGDKMVAMKFFIASLEKQQVEVDGLKIEVLETSGGDVVIANVERIKGLSLPPAFKEKPAHQDDEKKPEHKSHACGSFIPTPVCKMINTFESKMEGLRTHGAPHFMRPGCTGGHKHNGMRPHFLGGRPGPHHHHPEGPPSFWRPMHHGGPPHRFHHHGGPHGYHHSHHHNHGPASFLQAFTRGLVAVLIPVMAGITVGMVVSLLGLLTGRFIGFLWFRFARGGQRGYASLAQRDEWVENGEAENVRKASMESTETLPRYEDAPAYEESVGEKQ